MTIVLASHNVNKIKEISNFLKPLNIDVKSLSDFNLSAPSETGYNFKENSLIKSKFAFEKTGLPSLGDDSGFCIESLYGFPGVSSARFADAVGGYDKAFEILNKCISVNNKRSYFVTVLSFTYEHKGLIKTEFFEGKVCGQFSYPPKGENGFGYGSVFKMDGFSQTFAEMDDKDRIRINHRSQSINKFIEFLK